MRVAALLQALVLRSCLLGGMLGGLSCSMSGPSRVALTGSLPELRTEIAVARRGGELTSRGDIRELAEAVATRELHSANGSAAARRLRLLSGCANPLRSELERQADGTDEVAAAATLLLLEAGYRDEPELAARYAHAKAPAWRQVGARAAVASSARQQRQTLFHDGEVEVRRAALQAARVARDQADLAELIEVARLDPDPLAQSLAVQTIGAIGGTRAVSALRDLWPRAQRPLRLAIVEAWAKPATLDSGGASQLVWVLETMSDLPALRAALYLSRMPGEHQSLGRARVLQTLEHGASDEQVLAIELADWNDADVRKASLELGKVRHPPVRVAALARLAELPEHAASAKGELLKLARTKTSPDVRSSARQALVRLGDVRVAPLLRSELHSANSANRQRAALGLLELADYSTFAATLADDSPDVRLQVACSALANEDRIPAATTSASSE